MKYIGIGSLDSCFTIIFGFEDKSIDKLFNKPKNGKSKSLKTDGGGLVSGCCDKMK
ncbi:MAG: hypothetical protein H7A25_20380 [Leptospiraceae bacterium]|nr:hypothetical protein [Leptospiraceae bacterium]